MNDNVDTCGEQCDCGGSGDSPKIKIIICAIVGLAAAAVLARGFMKKAGTGCDPDQQSFVMTLPVARIQPASPPNEAAKATEEEQKKSTLWGDPLDSLASLNKVAAEKDAVFVFLPTGNDESTKTGRKEIEAAASKIMSRGTTIAAYILKNGTLDYAQVTRQVSAPCVLAMVKGRGMSVANDITEENLIQALVMASRPSSCGPSASSCGPSDCP